MKRTIIMGAGGRDFHNFNIVYRLITSVHPMRHITYELREIGTPTLTDALAPVLTKIATPVGAR